MSKFKAALFALGSFGMMFLCSSANVQEWPLLFGISAFIFGVILVMKIARDNRLPQATRKAHASQLNNQPSYNQPQLQSPASTQMFVPPPLD